MLKTYSDFSKLHGTPAHPGQPVHCDRGFDVWPGPGGTVYVIRADGSQQSFPSVAEAVKATAPAVAAQAQADALIELEKYRLAQLEAAQAVTPAFPSVAAQAQLEKYRLAQLEAAQAVTPGASPKE